LIVRDRVHAVAHQHAGRDGRHAGFVVTFQHADELNEISKQSEPYKQMSDDLQAIFDISYDVIYVTDGEGITLRVSSACERLWGISSRRFGGEMCL
jgi:PAS domain-containing protein